jgi:hypothetical protein
MDGFEKLDKKVENLKKLDKVATKLTEEEFNSLSDDDVVDIDGGFWQSNRNGYSGGYWIKCPSCGNDSQYKKNPVKLVNIDESEGVDIYHCNKCSFDFGIGYDGQYYDVTGVAGNSIPTGMYTS